jgi:type IV pilus assembly protein PilA
MGRHHQIGRGVCGGATTEQGFSLIELLIVVAIILVIAALAIPNMLRARMAANEASAADSVRQISRAEVAYNLAYQKKGYADSLANLSGPTANCLPSVARACIIDSSLAAASKSGYQFVAKGIASGASNISYVVGAAPVTFDGTGTKDFCTLPDGVLRSQGGASGNAPVNTVAACQAFPVAQ